tara:strand:- start:573 stop:1514 length:942 start_codon:yes stop_codon:yes gene_type:complete
MSDISHTYSPLVSVVMPTFENVALLGRAINSVLDQSYKNWELLIVDNSSNDGTEALVSKFQNENLNKKIKFYIVTNNGIIAHSRNLGINNANGEWIAFLDSDDWWEPDKLQISLKEASENNADLTHHDLFLATNKFNFNFRKKLRSIKLESPIFINLLRNGNYIFNSSVLVKSVILNQINNLDESPTKVTWEDYDCWLRVSLKTEKFHYISKPLGSYWIGNGNTSNPLRTIKNLLEISNIYMKNSFKTKPSWLLYSLGVNLLKLGFYKDALKFFTQIPLSDIQGLFIIKLMIRYHHAWIGSKLSDKTYSNLEI